MKSCEKKVIIPIRILGGKKPQKKKKNILLVGLKLFGSFSLALLLIVGQTNLFYAFEAHVINVTARICDYSQARSMGFWKTHPLAYGPLLPVNAGCQFVWNTEGVIEIFKAANASEMSDMLLAQLLALKFNLSAFNVGSYQYQGQTLGQIASQADALLCNPNSSREEQEAMKNLLDEVNNLHQIRQCSQVGIDNFGPAVSFNSQIYPESTPNEAEDQENNNEDKNKEKDKKDNGKNKEDAEPSGNASSTEETLVDPMSQEGNDQETASSINDFIGREESEGSTEEENNNEEEGDEEENIDGEEENSILQLSEESSEEDLDEKEGGENKEEDEEKLENEIVDEGQAEETEEEEKMEESNSSEEEDEPKLEGGQNESSGQKEPGEESGPGGEEPGPVEPGEPEPVEPEESLGELIEEE